MSRWKKRRDVAKKLADILGPLSAEGSERRDQPVNNVLTDHRHLHSVGGPPKENYNISGTSYIKNIFSIYLRDKYLIN